MRTDFVAKASTTIEAPPDRVWVALTTPKLIQRYMFGSTVISDFKVGHPILWRGEWKGRAYEDKGTILEVDPGRRLAYSHFSPLSGAPDVPESYHRVTIELSSAGGFRTRVVLTQDNNATLEAKEESERNWAGMLQGLKALLEAPEAAAEARPSAP